MALRLFSRAPWTRIRSCLSAGCSGDCVSVLEVRLMVSSSVRTRICSGRCPRHRSGCDDLRVRPWREHLRTPVVPRAELPSRAPRAAAGAAPLAEGSDLRDPDEVACGVAELTVARAPRLRRRL